MAVHSPSFPTCKQYSTKNGFAKELFEKYPIYFKNYGAVPWQIGE
jgi:hypothetical protein